VHRGGGDPGDPPILLVMGMGASMVWWEDGLCRPLADGRRFVIRYNHRDTGRSRAHEPGQPEYTVTDLVADASAMLDGYDISAAHIVGMSMAVRSQRWTRPTACSRWCS
jgi:pimeloyl-ACP methyl ester carboxylesterase